MACVLFVDDDPGILRVNRIYFDSRGHRVLTARSGEEALPLLKREAVDCVVLDVLMPGADGWALCREMKRYKAVPILFLTSLSERECLYQGFELGCDDYLTKPYELRELELRVLAHIRGRRPAVSEQLSFPPLELDAAGRRVRVDGQNVPLTAYEFDILLLLARQPGRVFSMEEIYREIWCMPDLGSAQTVRVHLARMRRKLELACGERKFIQVVWGKGFLFAP